MGGINEKMINIIIPTYNKFNLLKQARRVSIYQDYGHLKVLICNYRDTGKIKALIEKYNKTEDRIYYLLSKYEQVSVRRINDRISLTTSLNSPSLYCCIILCNRYLGDCVTVLQSENVMIFLKLWHKINIIVKTHTLELANVFQNTSCFNIHKDHGPPNKSTSNQYFLAISDFKHVMGHKIC